MPSIFDTSTAGSPLFEESKASLLDQVAEQKKVDIQSKQKFTLDLNSIPDGDGAIYGGTTIDKETQKTQYNDQTEHRLSNGLDGFSVDAFEVRHDEQLDETDSAQILRNQKKYSKQRVAASFALGKPLDEVTEEDVYGLGEQGKQKAIDVLSKDNLNADGSFDIFSHSAGNGFYGRPLSDQENATTGQRLSEELNNPQDNADYFGYRNRTKRNQDEIFAIQERNTRKDHREATAWIGDSSAETIVGDTANVAAAFIQGAGDTTGTILQSFQNTADIANRLQGNPESSGKNFLYDLGVSVKSSVEGIYNDKDEQRVFREVTRIFEGIDFTNQAKGGAEFTAKLAKIIATNPGFAIDQFAKSLPMMMISSTGIGAGVNLYAFSADNTKRSIDEYEKRYGKAPSPDEIKVMLAAGTLAASFDVAAGRYLLNSKVIPTGAKEKLLTLQSKLKIKNNVFKLATAVTGKPIIEGATEGIQEGLVIGSAIKDGDEFTDENKKTVVQAIAAGGAGGATPVVTDVLSAGKKGLEGGSNAIAGSLIAKDIKNVVNDIKETIPDKAKANVNNPDNVVEITEKSIENVGESISSVIGAGLSAEEENRQIQTIAYAVQTTIDQLAKDGKKTAAKDLRAKLAQASQIYGEYIQKRINNKDFSKVDIDQAKELLVSGDVEYLGNQQLQDLGAQLDKLIQGENSDENVQLLSKYVASLQNLQEANEISEVSTDEVKDSGTEQVTTADQVAEDLEAGRGHFTSISENTNKALDGLSTAEVSGEISEATQRAVNRNIDLLKRNEARFKGKAVTEAQVAFKAALDKENAVLKANIEAVKIKAEVAGLSDLVSFEGSKKAVEPIQFSQDAKGKISVDNQVKGETVNHKDYPELQRLSAEVQAGNLTIEEANTALEGLFQPEETTADLSTEQVQEEEEATAPVKPKAKAKPAQKKEAKPEPKVSKPSEPESTVEQSKAASAPKSKKTGVNKAPHRNKITSSRVVTGVSKLVDVVGTLFNSRALNKSLKAISATLEKYTDVKEFNQADQNTFKKVAETLGVKVLNDNGNFKADAIDILNKAIKRQKPSLKNNLLSDLIGVTFDVGTKTGLKLSDWFKVKTVDNLFMKTNDVFGEDSLETYQDVVTEEDKTLYEMLAGEGGWVESFKESFLSTHILGNDLSKGVKNKRGYTDKNLLQNDLNKDPVSALVRVNDAGNLEVEPNLVSLLATIGFDWISNSHKDTVHNDNKDINSLLNRPETHEITQHEIEQLGKGISRVSLANALGNLAYRALGLDLKKNSDANQLQKESMINSLGLAIIRSMEDMGYIETNNVDLTHKDIILYTDTVNKESTLPLIKVIADDDGNFLELEEYKKALNDSDFLSKTLKIESSSTGPQTSEVTDDQIGKKYKHTIGQIPKKTIDVLKNMGKMVWSLDQGNLAVLDLLGIQGFKEVSEYVEHTEGLNKNYVNGVEGQNLQTTRSFENLTLFVDKAKRTGDKAFYLLSEVWANGRIGYISNTVNPQQDKAQRFFFKPKSMETTVKSEKHKAVFRKGIAAGFGYDKSKRVLSKYTNEYASQEEIFEQILQDESLHDALYGLRLIRSGSKISDKQRHFYRAAIVKATTEGGEKFHTMDALVNLEKSIKVINKKYNKKTLSDSFKTNLFVERDGVTNGLAIGLMQFPFIKNVYELLARVGIYTVGKYSKENYQKEDGKPDNYEAIAQTWTKFNKESDSLNSAEKKAFRVLMGDIENNPKVSRNLAKYPLMTYIYGAGVEPIKNTLMDVLVENVYASFHENETPAQKTHRIELEKALAALTNYKPSKDRKNMTLTTSQREEIKQKLLDSYGENLIKAIEEYVPGFNQARKSINNAYDTLFTILNKHYEIAIDKIGIDNVTDEQRDQILEELQELIPAFETIDSEGIKERIPVFKVKFVAGDNRTEHRYVTTEESGKVNRRSLSARNKTLVLESPGVGPLIKMIHTFDSTLMQSILGTSDGMLNVHDAVGAGVAQIDSLNETLNQNFLDMSSQYSMIEATQNVLTQALQSIGKRKTDAVVLVSLGKQLFEKEVRTGSPGYQYKLTKDLEEHMAEEGATLEEFYRDFYAQHLNSVAVKLDSFVDQSNTARDLVFENITTVDQYDGAPVEIGKTQEPADFNPDEDKSYTATLEVESNSSRFPDKTLLKAALNKIFPPTAKGKKNTDDFLNKLGLSNESESNRTLLEQLFGVYEQYEGGNFPVFFAASMSSRYPPDYGYFLTIGKGFEKAFQEGLSEAVVFAKKKAKADEAKNGKVNREDAKQKANSKSLEDTSELRQVRLTGDHKSATDEKADKETDKADKKQTRSAAAKARTAARKVISEFDDMFTVIAKLGGIDLSGDLSAYDILKPYNKETGFGIGALVHKNGKGLSLSAIHEALTEGNAGFRIPTVDNDNNKDFTDAELLSELLANGGQGLFTDVGLEEQNRIEHDSRFEEENSPDQRTFFNGPTAKKHLNEKDFADKGIWATKGLAGKTVAMLEALSAKASELGSRTENADHREFLIGILNSLIEPAAKNLDEVTLKVIESTGVDIQGMTNTRNVFIALNKGTTGLPQGMSAEEAFTHEMVHVVVAEALKADKVLSSQLLKLLKTAKDNTTPEDLLNEVLMDEDIELKAAQKMYDYIFDNNNLDEFITFAITNENFRKHIGTVPVHSSVKFFSGDTFTEKLESVLDVIINWFVDISLGKKNPTVEDAVARIAFRLTGIQTSYVDKLAKFVSLRTFVSDAAVDKAKEVLGTLLDTTVDFIAQNNRGILAPLTAPITVPLKYLRDPETRERFKRLGDVIGDGLPETRENVIGKLYQEIKGFDGRDTDWTNLLRQSTKMTQQQRKETHDVIVDTLKRAFIKLSDKDKISLTNVLMRTDVVSLTGTHTLQDIKDLLSDKDRLAAEIKDIQNLIRDKDKKHADHLITQARGLGQLMHSNIPTVKMQMKNAFAINSLFAYQDDKVTRTGSKEVEALINQLATLRALELTTTKAKQRVVDVITNEASNDNGNGVTVLLDLLREYSDASDKYLFVGQKALKRKGYVAEINDPTIKLQVAPLKDEKELAKGGYKLVESLEKAETDFSDVPMGLYKNKYDRKITRMQTIMSITDNHRKGTSMYEAYGLRNDPLAQSNAEKVIEDTRRQFMKAVRKGSDNGKGRQLLPNIGPDGTVLDFTYNLDEQEKVQHLDSDLRMDKVLGTMFGSMDDKRNTETVNKTVVALAKRDYNSDYEENPSDFVIIGPKSDNPAYVEAYRLMPFKLREQIFHTFPKDTGGLPIKKHLVPLVIGQRKKSLSNIGWLDDRVMLKRIIKLIEDMWQTIIAGEKVQIVIKGFDVLIPNFISNLFLLYIRGVNPVTAIADMFESVKFMDKYQKDKRELRIMEFELKASSELTKSAKAKLERDIKYYKKALATNPVHELVEAGFFSSIVEDVEINRFSGRAKIFEKIISKDAQKKIPGVVKTAFNEIYSNEGTTSYKYFLKATQYSDFVARYSLYKRRKAESNLTSAQILDEVDKTFINYELPTSAEIQWLNDMGIWMFTKFYLRIQNQITKNATDHTARTLGVAGLQAAIKEFETIDDSSILFRQPWDAFNLDAMRHITTAITPITLEPFL